jgi:hypothetical protein
VELELGRSVVIDCGDDAGLAMAALREGMLDVLFTGRADVADRLAGLATAYGARLRRTSIVLEAPRSDP